MGKKKKTNQDDYEAQICVCGHPRSRHSGIEKWCYVSGCKCMEFKLADADIMYQYQAGV